MVIELTGVLEDGSLRGAGVPTNPRATIRIPLGVDLTLRLTLVRANGTLIKLGSDTVVWTVKKSASDASPVFNKSGTDGTGGDTGKILFTVSAGDTKQAAPGLFVYDIWYTSGGKRDPVVPLSPLVIEAAATLPP